MPSLSPSSFHLDSLEYQSQPAEAVVGAFAGTPKSNSLDLLGNRSSLSWVMAWWCFEQRG